MWESAIAEALSLDLEVQPRPSRDGTGTVELHNRLLAETNHRLIALHVAKAWGWSNHQFDHITRQRIAEAACRLVSYDFGFKKAFSYSRLADWDKDLIEYIRSGDTTKACGKLRTGRTSYVDRIEAAHKGYLCELYRDAEKILGKGATFSELADCMNQRSDVPTEERETLSLHPEQLRRWFHAQKGKQLAACKKPRLTEDQKEQRTAWTSKRK
jgi:hypothetical protein